jgi:hypothetical protein
MTLTGMTGPTGPMGPARSAEISPVQGPTGCAAQLFLQQSVQEQQCEDGSMKPCLDHDTHVSLYSVPGNIHFGSMRLNDEGRIEALDARDVLLGTFNYEDDAADAIHYAYDAKSKVQDPKQPGMAAIPARSRQPSFCTPTRLEKATPWLRQSSSSRIHTTC